MRGTGVTRIITKLGRREDGAIAVLAGLMLTVVIAATALAVDIGHQVYTERHLSSIVDLAALDAGHAIGNRREAGRSAYDVAYQYATESMTRNEFDYTLTDEGNSITLELGIGNSATKTFTPFPVGTSAAVLETANALRITATTATNFAFMPGTAGATKSAVVFIEPKTSTGTGTGSGCTNAALCPPACTTAALCEYKKANAAISVASTLGSYSSRNSFMNAALGGLVGGSISLTAVSYDGLASAEVTLGAIWTKLGLDAGSVSDVLTSQISLVDLMQAQIDILTAQGGAANLSAATALTTIRNATSASLHFTFQDLLDLGLSVPGSAADATVNVLTLTTVAAQVANGSNAVTFNMPVAVPGVASGLIRMAFIEPPVIAVGAAEQDAQGNWVTHARTAQARIFLDMTLASGITVGTTSVPVRLPLYIEAGRASADLTSIGCQTNNINSTTTVAATSDALAAYIGDVSSGAMSNSSQTPTPTSASIMNAGGLVTVTGLGSLTAASSSGTFNFSGAYPSRVQHLGVSSLSLSNLAATANFSVSPTGLTTATTIAQIRALFAPVLTQVEALVLKPLAATPLGITLGGADIANPSADCQYERLIQ
jgi:uncharacterized membrane protein